MKKIFFFHLFLHLLLISPSKAQYYAHDSLKQKADLISQKKPDFKTHISDSGKKTADQTVHRNLFVYPKNQDDFFRVKSISVIPAEKKLDEREKQMLEQEAEREFFANDILFTKNLDKIYFVDRATLHYKTYTIEKNGNQIINTSCNSCEKVMFKVIEHSGNNLVLLSSPQDESAGHLFEIKCSVFQ